MKLFAATGIFHPEAGGPATYLREILPHFVERGWQVRVLTFGAPHDQDYGYPVMRIPRQALPLRWIGYASASRALYQWADVVYIHSLGLPLWRSGRARRVAKIVGDVVWERAIRKRWIPPTFDIDRFQTSSFDHLAIAFNRQMQAAEVRSLDAIIVPSHYLKTMVIRWGAAPERVYVIYNAMPPLPASADLHGGQAAARAALGLPQDARLLLTAARLTPWKGVQHLIAALSAAPDVQLLVAGEGDMLPELRALAERHEVAGRVHFLGLVTHERLTAFMQAADYLALYSGYEGLSHTLLESLRVGTPAIASDKGGNPEVVQHDVNGLLVPYVDLDALKAALRTAFTPGTRDRLAAGTNLGLERFDFDRMLAQTTAVLSGSL